MNISVGTAYKRLVEQVFQKMGQVFASIQLQKQLLK